MKNSSAHKVTEFSTFHKVYERMAQVYDIAIGPLLKHGQKLALRALDLQPGQKILEVGIGTGLTLPLYRKDVHVIGVDLSESMLAKAQQRIEELDMKNVKLEIMSAEDLKFDDNSFDVVFAPSVFSVVNDARKALDEMTRVCRTDGLICVLSHFAGDTGPEKAIDKVLDPLSRKWAGFRMNTPRQIVEIHPNTKVILKKDIFALNFSTLYLLKKVTPS
jgi:phosphatidylethanolamine/phosphatidyl-N-methylethanolamine N-methyltransferase